MKNLKFYTSLIAFLILLGAMSCDDNIEQTDTGQSIVPERFKVDIPTSLTTGSIAGRTNGRASGDIVNGNDIYGALPVFIEIGEKSAELIEEIMIGIATNNITGVMFITFESDEDGRAKNLTVSKNSTYEGVTYEYELTLTDANSEDNADGGVGMQIFWNQSPIEGVAILKPYNIDRVKDADAGEAIVKIEYSEIEFNGYEANMTISIANFPIADPATDPWSVNNIKMFVGKKGDIIDIYGNSNHPNATFIADDEVGFSWSFVASGYDTEDIGVVELGLPSNSLNATSRSIILEDNAIKTVFTDQIQKVFPAFTDELIAPYLVNADAPGFFDTNGFIQGGTAPSDLYDPLVTRIKDLTPYNPVDIKNLVIDFK